MSELVWHCNCGRRVYADSGGRKPNETCVLYRHEDDDTPACEVRFDVEPDQPVDGLCICGHEIHEDEPCPEQVRLGGEIQDCGCDDYVPTESETLYRSGHE